MSGLGTTNPSYEIGNAIIVWEARRGPVPGEEKGAEKETAGVLFRTYPGSVPMTGLVAAMPRCVLTMAAINQVLINQIAKAQPLIQLTDQNQTAVRSDP